MSNDGSGSAGEESQPGDTMRERADDSSAKLWVLMEANRWHVAGALLLGVFLSMVILGVLDPRGVQQSVAASDPAETLFQAFVTAIITGVTLVVTLNQLVLSQELGPVGDQRSRMEGAMEFREDVEDVLETKTSPPEPASFLQALIDVTRSRANDLADAVEESRDEELKEQIHSYVDGLETNADEVSDQLDDAQFGTFQLLSAVLNFNYSWKIFLARRIRNDHRDALTDEVREAFDDLVEVLKFFGPAREHFKTLYFQWELVNLSRAMLYSAVPALIVTASMITYYDAQSVPGATLGISNDVLAISFGMTVAVAPFMILLAYILRISTVAKRTLSIGSFVLRRVDRSDEINWEENG
ncbi:hypothetical protein [Halorussus halophilus]|uniref:hypothetical protein n=1 Tax=Halorussus halophilus TaxID=2650975 RepID=UPI0013013060|nr:hypothetical protein [Halorussus halophilus]